LGTARGKKTRDQISSGRKEKRRNREKKAEIASGINHVIVKGGKEGGEDAPLTPCLAKRKKKGRRSTFPDRGGREKREPILDHLAL